jgi:hypothetical protein
LRRSAAKPVAIMIAAYKSENVIARAIASALAKPEAGEVVVVSDASPRSRRRAQRGDRGHDEPVDYDPGRRRST